MNLVESLVLGIFGLGMTELIVVGIVILLLFGSRLPSLARSLGRSTIEFKKGMSDPDDGGESR